MVDQAPLGNGPRPEEPPPRAVARSASELLQDLVTLAELQGKLCLVDLREGCGRLLVPAGIVAGGLVLALGTTPVALAALALWLVEAAQFTLAQALGIAALIGAVVAAVLLAAGVAFWNSRLNFFERTQTEWRQNVRWMKDAVSRWNGNGQSSFAKSSPSQFH